MLPSISARICIYGKILFPDATKKFHWNKQLSLKCLWWQNSWFHMKETKLSINNNLNRLAFELICAFETHKKSIWLPIRIWKPNGIDFFSQCAKFEENLVEYILTYIKYILSYIKLCTYIPYIAPIFARLSKIKFQTLLFTLITLLSVPILLNDLV